MTAMEELLEVAKLVSEFSFTSEVPLHVIQDKARAAIDSAELEKLRSIWESAYYAAKESRAGAAK